jgi:hypothetical protein
MGKKHKFARDEDGKHRVCDNCNILKDIECFGKVKEGFGRGGRRSVCNECRRILERPYNEAHREESTANSRRWKEENKKRFEQGLTPIPETKVCCTCGIEKPSSRYWKSRTAKDGLFSSCIDCRKTYEADHYQKNKDRIRVSKQRWVEKNREVVRVRRRESLRNRRRTDPVLRLTTNIRRRVLLALFGNAKALPTFKLIGAKKEEVIAFLSSQFYPNPETGEEMSLDNYGKGGWDIDHVIPVIRFDMRLPEEQRRAFNVSNMQPLWKEDHKRKHSVCGDYAPEGVTLESLMAKYLKWKEKYDKSNG